MNENAQAEGPSQTGPLIQNFFILLHGTGVQPDFAGSAEASQVLQALRAVLNGQPSGVSSGSRHDSFAEVAREWFQNNVSRWRPSYSLRLKQRLETGLLDTLGAKPLPSISPLQLLEVVRKIEKRDALETAKRVLRIASAVFRYGIATGRCTRDPTVDLRGALKPTKAVRHHAALGSKDLPRFLKALDSYQGDLTKLALELALLTFVRTAELRFAVWSEFEDLQGPNPTWRIPGERMKMRKTHLVPLSHQAINLLRRLRSLNAGSPFLFPANTRRGVISENTLLFALYRMGYKGRATVHGFRSMASTVLNEAQFNRDWIEMQLAHADNSVRGVYNTAQWLPGRRKMLQWWADYLDKYRV